MGFFKKLEIKLKDQNLTSLWKVNPLKKSEFEDGGPTVAESTQKVPVNIEDGAKIVKSEVTAEVSSPNTGSSFLNINGNPLTKANKASKISGMIDEIKKTSVPINTNSNTATIEYEFKANGSTIDEPEGSSTVSIKNATLEITYEVPSTPSEPEAYAFMPVPPQSCCIYCDGQIYMFDGVIRIQHNVSTKVEEEPNTEKYSYVNNALNEPDKITLDVMMSDVYTGGGPMVGQPTYKSEQSMVLSTAAGNGISTESSRSANAYGILKQMKENRQYVAVVTPQWVYCDMLITSIVANQDESCPYGWSGQITFQSRYAPKNPGYGASKAENTGAAVPTPALITGLWSTEKNETKKPVVDKPVKINVGTNNAVNVSLSTRERGLT